MRGLERLRSERLPRALDVEAERARRVEAVVEVARAMAASAAGIPLVAARRELSAEERRVFEELAAELGRRAYELGERAADLPPEELEAQAAGIAAICDRCHASFRIQP